MTVLFRGSLGWSAVVLGLTAWMLTPAPAVADTIDKAMRAHMGPVIEKLREAAVKNVGVLRFRAGKEGETPDYNRGAINLNMRNRLENWLIMATAEDTPPLGVLNDPGAYIAEEKKGLKLERFADLEKLFQKSYPLIINTRNLVKADAFLTGRVELINGCKDTRITIEMVDNKNRELREIHHFQVKTDRFVLADFSESYAFAQDLLNQDSEEQDAKAVQIARTNSSKPPESMDLGTSTRREGGLVELRISFDNGKNWQNVRTHADQSKAGSLQIDEPKQGDQIVLQMENVSDRKVGVVLTVCGESTLYRERMDERSPTKMTRWVLNPGEKFDVRGYAKQGDEKYTPFEVLSEEESQKEEALNSSSYIGAIHLFVLVEGKQADSTVNSTGLRAPVARKSAPADVNDLKSAADAIVKRNPQKASTAGLIRAGKTEAGQKLESVSFENPMLVETRTIWYRERKSSDK